MTQQQQTKTRRRANIKRTKINKLPKPERKNKNRTKNARDIHHFTSCQETTPNSPRTHSRYTTKSYEECTTHSLTHAQHTYLDVAAHDAGPHLGRVDAQGSGRQPQHDGGHLLPVAEELRDALPEGLPGQLEAGQHRLARVGGLLPLLQIRFVRSMRGQVCREIDRV